MPFTASGLHQKPYHGVYKEFVYTSTGEAMATIVAANYFPSTSYVSDMLASSDRIYIYASDGEGQFRVGSNGTTGGALIPVGWIDTVTTQASTGALNPWGVNVITATGNVNFTLTQPLVAGQMVRILQNSGSTSITITSTGGVSADTDTVLTLDGDGESATLFALNTTKWLQVAVTGVTVGTTNTSTVLHATS